MPEMCDGLLCGRSRNSRVQGPGDGMKTELRGCDSPLAPDCECKKYERDIFAMMNGYCVCRHSELVHTYEVTT